MDTDIKQIKQRGVLSVGSLLFQSGFSAVLGFGAFFILTLKSNLYILGIYNIVLAMMAFLTIFPVLDWQLPLSKKKKLMKKILTPLLSSKLPYLFL